MEKLFGLNNVVISLKTKKKLYLTLVFIHSQAGNDLEFYRPFLSVSIKTD